MDEQTFDTVTRILGGVSPRRGFAALVGGLALRGAGQIIPAAGQAFAAPAKKKKAKKAKHKNADHFVDHKKAVVNSTTDEVADAQAEGRAKHAHGAKSANGKQAYPKAARGPKKINGTRAKKKKKGGGVSPAWCQGEACQNGQCCDPSLECKNGICQLKETCTLTGHACNSISDCCPNLDCAVTDGQGKKCCAQDGDQNEWCDVGGQCCSGCCKNNHCAAYSECVSCTLTGHTCNAKSECCPGLDCQVTDGQGKKCCAEDGDTTQWCDVGGQCCSGYCGPNHVCGQPPCTPKICSDFPGKCGKQNDGCGGQTDNCQCSGGKICVSGTCQSQCTPNCNGRCGQSDGCGGTCPPCQCTPSCSDKCGGSDGCGGICKNTCGPDQACSPDGLTCHPICQPNCGGKECGDDGCCGVCGTCPEGEFCNNGTCQSTTPVCPPGKGKSRFGTYCDPHDCPCGSVKIKKNGHGKKKHKVEVPCVENICRRPEGMMCDCPDQDSGSCPNDACPGGTCTYHKGDEHGDGFRCD